MNIRALAVRYIRAKPKKIHSILPVLIMALLYGLSELPGTPLPNDPADPSGLLSVDHLSGEVTD